MPRPEPSWFLKLGTRGDPELDNDYKLRERTRRRK